MHNWDIEGLFIYHIKEFRALYPTLALQYGISEPKGIVLFVPKGNRVDSAVDLDHYFSKLQDADVSKNIIILLEKYSYLKIYDTIRVSSDLSVRRIRCFLSQSSNLTFVYTNHCKVIRRYAVAFYLKASSCLNYFMVITDCDTLKKDLTVILEGENSTAKMNGLYLMDSNQKFHLNVLQKHKKGSTVSDFAVYGIISGRSEVWFKGNVVVEKYVTEVTVSQCNKILLFGNESYVESMPALEIENNDVQCKHATAVGQLDANKLFYLQSRGLSSTKAQALLIEAFFDSFKKALDTRAVKKEIIQTIKYKMKRMDIYE